MWFLLRFYLTYCIFIEISQGVPLIGKNVRDAKQYELSFVVSIGRRNVASLQDSQFCTGTLISRRSVLTAAHCFEKRNVSDVVVIVGSVDLRLGKRYGAKSWITYNQWMYKSESNGLLMNDIGIITLAEKVKGCNLIPASLLTFIPEDLYGSKVRIAGWGDSEDGMQPMVLRTAVLKVIGNEECESKIESATNRFYYLPEYLFCTLADPWVLSTCGDSGSPILNKQNQLIGVHRGVCPNEETYADAEGFTKEKFVNMNLHLFHYRDFIKANKI